MKSLEVTKDIHWVGALDPNLRIFDIIMYTEYGTSYNSYIVKGSEKTALFETVKGKFYDEWLERIKDVIDPKEIDYIVLNHTEPDHAGSLEFILNECPNAQVVGSRFAITFLTEIANRKFDSIVVKEGDTISLGDKTIEFIMAPFLHWPDTMYSFVKESKTLITCDSFGCHYSDEAVFNDQIEGDFVDAYKYYFDMIMGPFKPYVLKALDKIEPLDVDIICPGHGPVLRTDLEKYINLYRQWATVEKPKTPKVIIPYVSAYGYTKKMALEIAKGVESIGNIEVKTFDLVESKVEDVMAEISDAKGIILGTPTIVAEALPPIWNILTSLNPVIHKGLIAGAFGSYGWSGEGVKNVEMRLEQLKFKMPVGSLKIKFNPNRCQLKECFDYGADFADEIVH